MSQNLAKQRAKAFNQEVAEHFYGILRNKLLELNLMDKPECILNCDESGFSGSYGRKRVFTRRGERNVHTFTADNEKLMYTVIVSQYYIELNYKLSFLEIKNLLCFLN